MTGPVLCTESLKKSYSGLVVTDNISLQIEEGELHAIIGPNGAGKTTLMAQLGGQIASDGGAIYFRGNEITGLSVPERSRLGIARTFQITSVFKNMTAEDNIAIAVQARESHSYQFWKPASDIQYLRKPARVWLERVGLGAQRNTLVSDMAHGDLRQLEFGMALALEPSVLLLDEPMAGLGVEESEYLIENIEQLKGQYSILLVEHDMDAVIRLADRITVLSAGSVIATGSAEKIQNDPIVRTVYLGGDDHAADSGDSAEDMNHA